MTKGTHSKGKRSKLNIHVGCRRCGKQSYHVKTSICASCGYGKSAKLRKYNWTKSP